MVVCALVLKGLTHIRVWFLLDSEGASVGPFFLEHIRVQKKKVASVQSEVGV